MKIYLGEVFRGKYGPCVGEIVSEDLELVKNWGYDRKYNYINQYGAKEDPEYIDFRIRIWENGKVLEAITPFKD